LAQVIHSQSNVAGQHQLNPSSTMLGLVVVALSLVAPSSSVASTLTTGQAALHSALRQLQTEYKNVQHPKADDVVLKSGTKLSHAEFEQDISNLFKIGSLGLSKEELAATPFGTSVKKIQAVIEDDMIPKVMSAHSTEQKELTKLAKELHECHDVKNMQWKVALPKDIAYKKTWSPKHKTCRQTEAGLSSDRTNCWEDEADKRRVMELKCKAFAIISAKYSNQNQNKVIVTKGGSEAAESYIKRISSTICGQTGGGGRGGFGKKGFLDEFIKYKLDCEDATRKHAAQKRKCQGIDIQYSNQKKACNNLQDQMDFAACGYAVDIKDSCEEYAECYKGRWEAYKIAETYQKGCKKGAKFCDKEKDVSGNELDRKAEWKGLKKMQCLVVAFTDGKVEAAEITKCKNGVHNTTHLIIKYPVIKVQDKCEVPKTYPSTAEYKTAEFAPLPALAKGKTDANECTGVAEISTMPASGSPSTCKCERITMNGPYSPGPVVKCVDCHDTRRTQDKNSCPEGTKLFSPRSRADWKSFISSAQPLRAPNWIIDVTRPQNGCGGCTGNAMNSGNTRQSTWTTQDNSPWWLRSTRYSEPNGDYHSNCYLDLWHAPKNSDSVTWNDGSCSYHAKSYYCQLMQVSTSPKSGSPKGCLCTMIALTGSYSAKTLLRCKGCLDVHKSTQKNSCPKGTKIFAPASRADWKTFLGSAGPLRSPHWIIDVTRPQNGCGGCTRFTMNSATAPQATWKTADGAPWWLRSSRYNEPNGDYNGNCYLDLWQTPANENGVTWNDGRCNYHANSYYCQLAAKKR